MSKDSATPEADAVEPLPSEEATLARVFEWQEQALLSRIEAVRATRKGELIGADVEVAFREALSMLMPASMRVVAGFVVRPGGALSSHFDGLLVDTRYPLLAAVAGSALVPLHALLGAIELKTKLTGTELDSVLDKEREVAQLDEVLAGNLEEARRRRAEHYPEGMQFEAAPENLEPSWFAALALTSSMSEVSIAARLWKAESRAHLMVLRPGKEIRPPARQPDVPIDWMGAQDGVARHYWLEGYKPQASICIRRTKFGYGFFLLQTLIQQALGVRARRRFTPAEVEEHLNDYVGALIDVDERLRRG